MKFLVLVALSFVCSAHAEAADVSKTPTALGEFKDSDYSSLLAQTKSSNKTAIIYSWSPHMKLSQMGLPEVQAYARKNGFKLSIVLDPNANPKLAREISQREGWSADVLKVAKASALLDGGVRVHYPAYFFIQSGKLKGGIVPGYKTELQLNAILKERGLN